MRPPPRLPSRSSRSVASLFLFVVATHMAAVVSACKYEACQGIFENSPQHSPKFCAALRQYERCLNEVGPQCKGDLTYRAYKSMVTPLKIRHNCNRHHDRERTEGGHHATPPPLMAAPPPPPPPSKCVYQGRKELVHCALFGDPHLKTFGGNLETCRVRGAWPLIENRFLAVQVTNEEVLPGSNATATTKVTVIVKNSSTECTTEKILEARGGEPLPDTFNDGTTESGPDRDVTLTSAVDHHGPRVEVHIRYIESTVVIRKVGRYLTFSAQMPVEVVNTSEEDVQQLCVQGCFTSERMDPTKSRGNVFTREEAEAGCLERQNNEMDLSLVTPYLDWCVFDLMTTGDYDFVKAARSAHHDTRWLDPKSLERATGTPLALDDKSSDVKSSDVKSSDYSTASSPIALAWLLIFVSIVRRLV